MLLRRLRLYVVLLLFAACACDTTTTAQGFEQPSADFEAPDSDGWGVAAGLRYLEIVVAREKPALDRPLPLVILIHGLGDRPRRAWASELAIDRPVRVVLPQAPTPWHKGYTWFEYRFPDNEPEKLARDITDASNRVARMLATLLQNRPTVGQPIVSGFSQGGMLSFALALQHPALCAQAIPISGGLPQPLWPRARATDRRYPPLRALHGTADPIVPFEPTERLVERLHELGFDATLARFEGVEHTISPEMSATMSQLLTRAVARAAASSQRSKPGFFERARAWWKGAGRQN